MSFVFGFLSSLILFQPVTTQSVADVVSESRLSERLSELGQYGALSDGGVTRQAFSDEDVAARDYIRSLMQQSGLSVRLDAAANLIGRRPGTSEGLPAIALGSHIDTVPEAGLYDGPVGVIGALEVIEVMNALNLETRHPIEVIVFTDEEGSMVGSRAMGGKVDAGILETRVQSGFTVKEGLMRLGGTAEALSSAALSPNQTKAFLELHVEQGGVLENAGATIGIVEGIVGIRWWDVTVQGVANHAGTTPMKGRRDALVAASRFVLAVQAAALDTPGRQVATVGRIRAEPGAPNVIPGKVTMSLEIRDLDEAKIGAIFKDLQKAAAHIEEETETTFEFSPIDADTRAAFTDRKVREFLETVARGLSVDYLSMPSGAGHDSQNLADRVPIGMIFIPSRGGISHSPNEFSKTSDIKTGVTMLAESVLLLDREDW
ncbi:MAG: Zn-dependent hydrolase [Acidobacteriota bacterium]|nr:MAG: Zn-dependent hydrolase [Acidobacteriota bacterium]